MQAGRLRRTANVAPLKPLIRAQGGLPTSAATSACSKPKPAGRCSRSCTERAAVYAFEADPVTARAPAALALRTFIVEDNAVILGNLVDTLEETTPVQVVGSAGDENTALDSLLSMGSAVDLVIIDIFLKSGSGLGVLRRMAQAQLQAHRVVLTNYATPEMRHQCLALGAHRMFDKSNHLDDLIDHCAALAADGGRSA